MCFSPSTFVRTMVFGSVRTVDADVPFPTEELPVKIGILVSGN